MTRPNIKYASHDELAASRRLLEAERTCDRPNLGWLILGLYVAFLSLFLYWVLA